MPNVLELNPTNFLIRGINFPGPETAFAFLQNGTLKISGNFTMSALVFPFASYTIAPTAGFWFKTIEFYRERTRRDPHNPGLLRISQGTFNVGTTVGDTMSALAGRNSLLRAAR